MSFCYALDGGHVNALCTNHDGSMVFVGGRTLLKIFSIQTQNGQYGFSDYWNFRTNKQMNLNYSSCDVAWSTLRRSIVASASTNRAVILFDLDRASHTTRADQTVLVEHTQIVNRVAFDPFDAHRLLTASNDGTVRLFDVRTKEVLQLYMSQSSSLSPVRDVQFDPLNYQLFSACNESGSITTWDLRMADRYQRNIMAHTGPVFSIAYHPTERNTLVSGGRDKLIRLWKGDEGKLSKTIQAIESVSKVRWRPGRHHQITSSSLVMDYSIYVWDFRRPYLPLYVFSEHSDTVTGFSWICDGTVLVSASKDCTLRLQHVDSASKPDRRVYRGAAAIAPDGMVAFALAVPERAAQVVAERASSPIPQLASQVIPRSRSTTAESYEATFVRPNKTLFGAYNDMHDKNNEWEVFEELAKMYIIDTRNSTVGSVAYRNAEFAIRVERPDVAATWQILANTYDPINSIVPETERAHENERGGDAGKTVQAAALRSRVKTIAAGAAARPRNASARLEVAPINLQTHSDPEGEGAGMEATNSDSAAKRVLQPSVSAHARRSRQPSIAHRRSGHPTAASTMSYTPTSVHPNAVEPREVDTFMDDEYGKLVFAEQSTSSNAANWLSTVGDFNQSDHFDRTNQHVQSVGVTAPTQEPPEDLLIKLTLDNEQRQADILRNHTEKKDKFNVSNAANGLPTLSTGIPSGALPSGTNDSAVQHQGPIRINEKAWQESAQSTFKTRMAPLLGKVLRYYADMSDVQHAVTFALVFRTHIPSEFSTSDLARWFRDYIRILRRFSLHRQAASIIKMTNSWLPSVANISLDSTTFNMGCTACRKLIETHTPYCPNCRTYKKCAICNLPTTGLYALCRVCGHGGHYSHMMKYYSQNRECPTGCGHICEPSLYKNPKIRRLNKPKRTN